MEMDQCEVQNTIRIESKLREKKFDYFFFGFTV